MTYSKEIDGRGATVLARFNVSSDFQKLTNFRDLVVTDSLSETSRHFGSRIARDQKGNIYFSVGDRGVRSNGQNLRTHSGAILRVTASGAPSTRNPFVANKKVKPEIYSYGHRNPQGLVFDAKSQSLWALEHGPRGGDELNLVKKGKNYGWPQQSYGKEYSSERPVGKPIVKGIELPVYQYTPTIAPSSLHLYSGDAFPAWKGSLLAGALALTHLNRIVLKGTTFVREERLLNELNQRIRSVTEGPDGFIYVGTDRGIVYRIRPKK